ncbi:flippase [Vibrio cyclitrophicus]|uniref:flippase n=1 Tax=Vibrio cyclitrophicus TaxID=47951 RepID=UPI0002EED317|nr:flippase [Vibrio cyclitrophicus]OED75337.1 hypothetical protein OAS_16775 [Vibrio cyclitrophicus ZF65]PMJ76508.1 hypothetical protein BCU15_02525 [Vibrio cyclitrophicus]
MLRKLEALVQSEIALKAALALIIKVIGAAGAFLLNIVIARSLGAEQAGYFFLAQAFLVILSAFVRQGLDNALVRYIAGYQVANAPKLVAGIYRLSLIKVLPFSICAAFTLWFSSAWLADTLFAKPLLEWPLKWCALALVPLSLSQLHGFCFQGQKKIAQAMMFESAVLAVLAIVFIWLIKPSTAASAMLVYLFASSLVCLLAFILWNKSRTPKVSCLDLEEKKQILLTAKPLFVIVVLAQITQWIGQLLLGAWGSAEDVALFATAQRTAMLTSFVLIAVNAIAAPKFAEAYKQSDLSQVRDVAKLSGKLMTLCALPIVGFMLVFAPWFMSFFGSEFVQGANILRVLALGQFINVITGSVGYLLQMTGYEKVLRNNVFISSVIMIFGSVLFIPLYGVTGAAWVTAIAIATQNLLCVHHVKKKLGFNTLKIFSR